MKNIIFLVLASLLGLVVGEVRATSIYLGPTSYHVNEKLGNRPDGIVINEANMVSLVKECERIEWVIKAHIDMLSSCKVDKHCIAVPSQYPFGCQFYVNEFHYLTVKNKISAFRELCTTEVEHNCSMPLKPVCRDGRCVGEKEGKTQ